MIDSDPANHVRDHHAVAASRSFYETLLDSEWTSPVKLAGFQEETLKRYLSTVIDQVPYHRDRLGVLLDRRGKIDLRRWLEVPIMSRRDLETHGHEIAVHDLPREHGRVVRVQTSGSSGSSLTLRKSGLHTTAMTCAFYRLARAFGLDWDKDLVSIRAYDSIRRGKPADNTVRDIWGPEWITPACTGERTHLSVHTPIGQQLDLLRSKPAAYVNTSAYNASALATEVARTGDPPPEIAAILTVGEYVSDDLRAQCATYLKCDIIDAFSSGECGTLATQCPDGVGYHMVPEIGVLEVLKPDGRPCGPGETGLMTATPFYNYAMPLVRYQSEDYVTVAGTCACGRSAPALSEVLGRGEHQFIMPDGSRVRPAPDSEAMRRFIGFRRWQLAQIAQHCAELRVMDRKGVKAVDRAGVSAYVASLLHPEMKVSVRTVAALGPTSGGKFATVMREWRAVSKQ